MGSRTKSPSSPKRSRTLFLVTGLCCVFYIFGAWQSSGSGKGDRIAMNVNMLTESEIMPNLRFESHHNDIEASEPNPRVFEPCDVQCTDYTPCHEEGRAMRFPRENMIHKERHCPSEEEKLNCLIPAPKGYMTPFPWPKSRDLVYHGNVAYKSVNVEKENQDRVEFQGNVFRFPGGEEDAYIDELASVIPISNGSIRTALDTGCGVC